MEFDPRYDPAFQRGGDERGGNERGGDTGGQARPPVPSAPAERVTFIEVAESKDAAQPVYRVGRNPYVLTLWILGPVLMIVGVLGLWWGLSATYLNEGAGTSRVVGALANAAFIFSPVIVAIGLLVIAGLLFLAAVHWHRSPAPADRG